MRPCFARMAPYFAGSVRSAAAVNATIAAGDCTKGAETVPSRRSAFQPVLSRKSTMRWMSLAASALTCLSSNRS